MKDESANVMHKRKLLGELKIYRGERRGVLAQGAAEKRMRRVMAAAMP
jgi:hypothetical protein